MRNYIAFSKKELLESIRTYKMLILLIIFFLFGVMNPLVAKLTPEILKMVGSEGIIITLPAPSAMDSWMQFFKNISQMGIIVVVILFSGVLANEVSKGTLINMLTKGLSRSSVVLSKYTVMILTWSLAYALCFFTTLGYTVYLFPNDVVLNLWAAGFALWLFGVFLISVLMLFASITRSSYACLLGTGIVVVALMLINIAPSIQAYNPISLVSDSTALLKGAVELNRLFSTSLVAMLSSGALVGASIWTFGKKQL